MSNRGKWNKGKRLRRVSRHLLAWFRSVGLVSLLLGGVGLMQDPIHFWWSVAFIYLAFLVGALDFLIVEPWVSRLSRRWKVFFAVVYVALILAFSVGVAFVDAPLWAGARLIDAEELPGTVIAGIPWRPEFAELSVTLTNPTMRNYEDLDIVLMPDQPVAAIAQINGCSDITFEDQFRATAKQVIANFTKGTAQVNPLVLKATDAGYRIRCSRLPPKASIDLVLAIAAIRPNDPNAPADFFSSKYWLRSKLANGSSYWYGHQEGDVYIRAARPQRIGIRATYTAAQRRRHASMELPISDMFLNVLPKHP